MSSLEAEGPVSGAPAAAFDPAIIAYLREMGEAAEADVLGEVLNEFLSDAAKKLDVIDAAIANGDADRLMRAAHDLCGSSGNVGAAGLSSLCRPLEAEARSGMPMGAAGRAAGIRKSFGGYRAEALALLERFRTTI